MTGKQQGRCKNIIHNTEDQSADCQSLTKCTEKVKNKTNPSNTRRQDFINPQIYNKCSLCIQG